MSCEFVLVIYRSYLISTFQKPSNFGKVMLFFQTFCFWVQ